MVIDELKILNKDKITKKMIYKGRVWGSPSHTRNAVMEQGEQSQQQQPQEFCVPEQALAVHSLLPQDHQLEGGKEGPIPPYLLEILEVPDAEAQKKQQCFDDIISIAKDFLKHQENGKESRKRKAPKSKTLQAPEVLPLVFDKFYKTRIKQWCEMINTNHTRMEPKLYRMMLELLSNLDAEMTEKLMCLIVTDEKQIPMSLEECKALVSKSGVWELLPQPPSKKARKSILIEPMPEPASEKKGKKVSLDDQENVESLEINSKYVFFRGNPNKRLCKCESFSCRVLNVQVEKNLSGEMKANFSVPPQKDKESAAVIEEWWNEGDFAWMLEFVLSRFMGYKPALKEEDEVAQNMALFDWTVPSVGLALWKKMQVKIPDDVDRVDYVRKYLEMRQEQREPRIDLGPNALVLSELLSCYAINFEVLRVLWSCKHDDCLDVLIFEFVPHWRQNKGNGVCAQLTLCELPLFEVLTSIDPLKRYFVLANRLRQGDKLLLSGMYGHSHGQCLKEIPRLKKRHYGQFLKSRDRLTVKSPLLKDEVWLKAEWLELACRKFPDERERKRLACAVMFSSVEGKMSPNELVKKTNTCCWLCGHINDLEDGVLFRCRFVNAPVSSSMVFDIVCVCVQHYELQKDQDELSVFFTLMVDKKTGVYAFEEYVRAKVHGGCGLIPLKCLDQSKVELERNRLGWSEGVDVTLELCYRVVGRGMKEKYTRMMVFEFVDGVADEHCFVKNAEVQKVRVQLYSVPSWDEVVRTGTNDYCVVFEVESVTAIEKEGWLVMFKERQRFESKNGWVPHGFYTSQSSVAISFGVFCPRYSTVLDSRWKINEGDMEMEWRLQRGLLKEILRMQMSVTDEGRRKINEEWCECPKVSLVEYYKHVHKIKERCELLLKERVEHKEEYYKRKGGWVMEKEFAFKEESFEEQFQIVQAELNQL